MKKIVLLTALISLFCGCEEVPGNDIQEPETPEVPTMAETWKAVKEEYLFKDNYIVVVDTEVGMEEAKWPRLTLNDDGTGSCDVIFTDNNEVDTHMVCDFTWEVVEDAQRKPLLVLTNKEIGVYMPYQISLETHCWFIEEFTADKLVLQQSWFNAYSTDDGDGFEEHYLKYTFEKVE